MVIEADFAISSKARALKHALSVLPPYDTAVILDADNIMAADFLEKINREIDKGYVAVQGQRTAKNTNTSIALLDAISEATNNRILRKGHTSLGLSSALIGSGMGFNYSFYKQAMAGITISCEDKELELEILRQGQIIQYAPDALVYDEKVQKTDSFRSQRTRWVSAQLDCLRKYAYPALIELVQGKNIDFVNKVFQTVFPPRILLFGFVCLGMGTGWWLNSTWLTGLSLSSFILFILSMLLSIPGNLLRQLSFREILKLPVLFTILLLVLRSIRQSKGKLLVTPKNFISSPESQLAQRAIK